MDPAIILVVLAVLCVGGLILAVVLPLLSGVFEVLGTLLEFVFNIVSGGPVAWCGCLLFLILLLACCGLIVLVATSGCGTPGAAGLCAWLGL